MKSFAIIIMVLFVVSCGAANVETEDQLMDPPEEFSNIESEPLETRVVNEAAKPTPPLDISIEDPGKFRIFPPGVEEFIDWTILKLTEQRCKSDKFKDRGYITTVIVAIYEGKTLNVAVVRFGDSTWQTLARPGIEGHHTKELFLWEIGYNRDMYSGLEPLELHPAFGIDDPKLSEAFTDDLINRMKASKLTKNVQVSWRDKDGIQENGDCPPTD